MELETQTASSVTPDFIDVGMGWQPARVLWEAAALHKGHLCTASRTFSYITREHYNTVVRRPEQNITLDDSCTGECLVRLGVLLPVSLIIAP